MGKTGLHIVRIVWPRFFYLIFFVSQWDIIKQSIPLNE